MPQTDSPLARLIRAREGLLKATVRKNRPRLDLIPVVTKLDDAIRAIQSQTTRHRQAPMYRAAYSQPALARPAWDRRQRVARLLQIDQDEMRLNEAQIAASRRRNR